MGNPLFKGYHIPKITLPHNHLISDHPKTFTRAFVFVPIRQLQFTDIRRRTAEIITRKILRGFLWRKPRLDNLINLRQRAHLAL